MMQALFPAPGQTTPRLRFPEFNGTGEWQAKTIDQMGEVVTGSTPPTSKRQFYGGSFMFVTPADISELRFVEKTNTTLTEAGLNKCRLIPEGSTLFVCIGSTIGKVAQSLKRCATNQQINAVIPKVGVDPDFLYFRLSHDSMPISQIAGRQAVPIINKSSFERIEIVAPCRDEQQRIAACLSALDDDLTAQMERVAVLRAHKAALMQQLFPALGAGA